jgi:tetratricopeptide (TPR) repeat protein
VAAAASPTGPEDLGHRAALDAGIALLDAGQAAAAVPYLRRANEVRETPLGLVRLASAYRDLGRRAEAIESYERALTLEGRGAPDLHARVGLAAVLADEGELEPVTRAAELLSAVLEVEPKNSPALFSIARCYDRAWRLTGWDHMRDQAERARQRARAADPRTPEERRDALRLRAVAAQRRVEVRPVDAARFDEAAGGEEPAPASGSVAVDAPDAAPEQPRPAGAPAKLREPRGVFGRLVAALRKLRG